MNDNVPVFTSSTFHTTIMEDAPTGTDVLLVNSSDADVGINSVIRYFILSRSVSVTDDAVRRTGPGEVKIPAVVNRESRV